MKLGPVAKLDKKIKTRTKKFSDDAMSSNCDVMSYDLFMTNSKQSGSRIADIYSVKLTFLLTLTLFLTKTKDRTNKSVTQLSHFSFG